MADEDGKQVAVRLDADTLARVDERIPLYGTRGHKATRSDALRALILDGLDATPKTGAPRVKKAKGGGR